MSTKNNNGVDMTTPYTLFCSQIADFPLLTAEEEKALARKIAAGDQQAKEALINANYRLVISRARLYQSPDVEILDLIQDGIVGLIKAAENFSPNYGRFSTYAVPLIDKEIRKFSVRTGKPVRIPQQLLPLINRISVTITSYQNKTSHNPTISELSEILNLSEDIIKGVLAFCYPSYSFDQLLVEGKQTTSTETLPTPEDEFIASETKQLLNSIINSILTPKEIFVIRGRFGFPPVSTTNTPLTLKDLSEHLGLTIEGVRKIETRSVKKIHSYFIEHGYSSSDFSSLLSDL